jgi:DNA-binding transcriptional LysR family regulator
MDLLQLEYFCALARTQHVTRAAAELGVAQPSLSRSIARLEQDLGVPLFDRQGRLLRLNRFGVAFLGAVTRALSQLEEGRREVTDIAGLQQGQIAIAATTLRWIPEVLQSFRRQHPRVRFRLIQSETEAMRRQLEAGEIDLGLTSQPMLGPNIRWQAVVTEEILLAVPAKHRLARRRRVDLSEVRDEPFVSLKRGYDTRDLTDGFCLQAGFTPRSVCEVDEPAAIRALVRAGLGIAFLPEASWRTTGEDEPLPVHIGRPRCERSLGLAWREDRYLSVAAREFRRFVVEYFADLR